MFFYLQSKTQQELTNFTPPPCLPAFWQVTPHIKAVYLPDSLADTNSSEWHWAEDKQRWQHSGRGGFQEGNATTEYVLGFGFLNFHEKPNGQLDLYIPYPL